MVEVTPESVLAYWFGDASLVAVPDAATQERWFRGGAAVDAEIGERFGETLRAAAAGALDAWAETPAGRLALVVVLDQFSRNVYRGTAAAFDQDARALSLSMAAMAAGLDEQGYGFFQRLFLYTPLEHAEDINLQRRCVVAVARLAVSVEGTPQEDWGRMALRFAVQHHDIVAQFGRFPHRNATLGRAATPEEAAWLDGGGARFGQ